MGGTFNPIHWGHVHLARAVAKAEKLDLIVVIPTGQPPHKAAPELASAEDRLTMCRLAFKDDPLFYVSDTETKREGRSYTYETLRELKKLFKAAQIFLIVGADMFMTLGEWVNADEILSSCTPCAAVRGGVGEDLLHDYARRINMPSYAVVPFAPENISSTEIRALMKSGGDCSAMLPPGAAEYALCRNLYREAPKMTYEQFSEKVRTMVKPERYRHTLGVVKAAQELAEKYGGDILKARTAAVLHDIMKDAEPDVQLQTIEKFGIILTAVERAEPKLWHAVAGSAYIRQLGVDDTEIIDAVRYHTTARGEMTLLDKIIYVADFISEDRSYDGVEEMRALAAQSLDAAYYEGLRFSLQDLAQRGKFLHPDSVDAYNRYLLGKAQ